MNIFDFAHEHPILTFLLAAMALHFPVAIIRELRRPRDKYTPR